MNSLNQENNLKENKSQIRFKNFRFFDNFIQNCLEKFKIVEPRKEFYDATGIDANYIISHKSTIPDLVIWNKKFNKNYCFEDADYNEENPFPRFQFFIRIKGINKKDKDKKKDKKFKEKINKNNNKVKIDFKNKKDSDDESDDNGKGKNNLNTNIKKTKEIGINGKIKNEEKTNFNFYKDNFQELNNKFNIMNIKSDNKIDDLEKNLNPNINQENSLQNIFGNNEENHHQDVKKIKKKKKKKRKNHKIKILITKIIQIS